MALPTLFPSFATDRYQRESSLVVCPRAEFLDIGLMNTFKWLRIVGDTVFAIGTVTLGWFVLGLKTGWSLKRKALQDGVG